MTDHPHYDGDVSPCGICAMDSDNRAALVVVGVLFLFGAAVGFALGYVVGAA